MIALYNPSTWDYSTVGQTTFQRQNNFTSTNEAFIMTLLIFKFSVIQLAAS